jgi:hypothetical protein
VTPHGEAALETKEEILADCFDGLEQATVDRPRDAGGEALRAR